mmetsp:Transcript_14923/g.22956  ORF Transcript_14923/g.22956 Transcript_14923/m.22956 type:complete len:708 (-) Transcript_14923:1378-3501(-)
MYSIHPKVRIVGRSNATFGPSLINATIRMHQQVFAPSLRCCRDGYLSTVATHGDGIVSDYAERISTNDSLKKDRIWGVKTELPLQKKIEQFLETPPGDLNRLDLFLKTDDLMEESCKLGSIKGMQQAENILNRMLQEKRAVSGYVIPAKAFEKIIFGWGKLADSSSTAKMREILKLMKREYIIDLKQSLSDLSEDDSEFSRASCQPTTETYNTLLTGLARIAKRDATAAFEAESILDEMMICHRENKWHTKPNTRSFTHVIQAHGNTGLRGAADRAERVLKWMRNMHQSEKANYKAKFGREYNMDNLEANIHQIVTPDPRVFSTAIVAMVNSNAKGSTHRAVTLLKELLDSGEKLDIYAFNAVIMGYSNMADKSHNPMLRYRAAVEAENVAFMLLHKHSELCAVESEMSDEDLDVYWRKQLTISFNNALNAWARSDVKEAGQRADKLWQLMLENPLLQPDRISMNTTIKAWSRAFNPLKAEEILNFVSDLYDSGDIDDSAKPDGVSYCTAMSAWAKSNSPNKTANARRLLETMLAKYSAGNHILKPNIIAFTSVLNSACTSTLDKEGKDFFGISSAETEEIYSIALQTYNEIIDDTYLLGLRPDTFVFATMLKVIATHIDASSAERRQLVQGVFDDTCAAGQVSSFVIRELRVASPDKDLLARLLGSEDLANHLPSVTMLPSKWIKRVPNKPRFRHVDKESTSPRTK